MIFENRFANRWWGEPNFFKLMPKALLASMVFPGFENFLLTRFVRSRFQTESRRHWLLSLAYSWLGGLLPLAVVAIASYFLSYLNLWTWMWGGARLDEPPMWIFWLTDARPQGLLFCSLLGFVPALLTGVGVWSWLFVPAALFPGMISLPGAWICVLSERIALWIRAEFLHVDPTFRRDITFRLVVALVVWVFVMVMGPALRDWVEFVLKAPTFHPEWRLLQWTIGLALLCTLETALSMAALHFYFPATAEAPSPEVWNLRLGRPPSPWDRVVLQDVSRRAEQKWQDLQATIQGLDIQTRARIPAALLAKMEQQVWELATFRQKSK